MNNLPPNWSWVKLGDVCEIVMGQSPPSSTYNTDQIGLPFFQGKADDIEIDIALMYCDADTEKFKVDSKDPRRHVPGEALPT